MIIQCILSYVKWMTYSALLKLKFLCLICLIFSNITTLLLQNIHMFDLIKSDSLFDRPRPTEAFLLSHATSRSCRPSSGHVAFQPWEKTCQIWKSSLCLMPFLSQVWARDMSRVAICLHCPCQQWSSQRLSMVTRWDWGRVGWLVSWWFPFSIFLVLDIGRSHDSQKVLLNWLNVPSSDGEDSGRMVRNPE